MRLMLPKKLRQASGGNTRTGPEGFLLSRTATPFANAVTSTQLPPSSPLWELLRHDFSITFTIVTSLTANDLVPS